jgi:negative regulator of flagellin synthesis FlgM
MKIGPLDNKPPVAPAAAERKGAAAQPAVAEASSQVALSPAATALSGMASDPTFDAAKVERIAQAIRDGKFTVNPEAIADKLIVNAEELLGRKAS